ncbi:hypothetical protein ACFVMC_15300 [Nocardia sp. NPDC127579]|uniref:hypothetical protein n=1 Tax=Nocardia sp. NPDC127579 TaxID=3345402 RepID=UPI0036265B7E
MVLLTCVVWLGGCASKGATTVSTETPQYQPGFVSLPNSCTEAVQPLQTIVDEFAGELYRPDAEFVQATRVDSRAVQTLECRDLEYSVPIPRDPGRPGVVPISRSLSIRYQLDKEPRRIGYTTQGLVSKFSRGHTQSAPVSGIGDDGISWVDEAKSSRMVAGVEFVLGNLFVKVLTTGWDWSSGSAPWPAAAPELAEKLRAGAESIAKEIVRQSRTALPTAVFTPPVTPTASSTTTASPTTARTPEAEVPAWNPCAIPDADTAAAGLERGLSGHEGFALDTPCPWHGEWFNFEIYSTIKSFESVIYSNRDYLRPIFRRIGDRNGVEVDRRFANAHCAIAFDVAQNSKSGTPAGTLVLEGRAFGINRVLTDRDRAELCTEVTRVAETLLPVLPPGA